MCLRGASAIENVLKRNPGENLGVLVVWEPVLASDWSAPGRLVQWRINDPRVTQFWDKQHLVARELSDQLSAKSEPHCCRDGGVLWDLVALYPKQVLWQSASPDFVDGPVVKVSNNVAKMLEKAGEQTRLLPH